MSAENSVRANDTVVRATDVLPNRANNNVSMTELAIEQVIPADFKIAVLIPCYNEEATVGVVVKQFRAELPGADIYVFDNNSSDATVARAREAGAKVFYEARQGKGFV